ncbi:hypothetical protein [Candidatus Nephthysia bennettiae]|uniref:Uncharacterized protein n=1 Tax=Candidatus Nephthysia bennettiae TaxID=3127016 RepID=A0A934K4A4_9BACT|nr:hypothetical protein [Candidatus Dormibacteraeota bacterium]MBJ7614228.1 hypothetical protein [Candidatus Dormibacteraeota bacterium]
MDGSAWLFALKVAGTPLVIGGATLAGRRWGPTVSGWIGGLPLASGPLTYFLTVEQGAAFGAASATATIAGLIAVAAFAVAFSRLSSLGPWPLPAFAGLLVYLLVAACLVVVPLPPLAAFATAAASLLAAIRLVGSPARAGAARRAPAWDIPARASVATALVVCLSAAAGVLGPRVVGLIAPFPVYASIMASFAHALDGPASSVRLLRGVLAGAFGFACFYLAVALLATHGVAGAFVTAVASALTVQAGVIWLLRRLGW